MCINTYINQTSKCSFFFESLFCHQIIIVKKSFHEKCGLCNVCNLFEAKQSKDDIKYIIHGILRSSDKQIVWKSFHSASIFWHCNTSNNWSHWHGLLVKFHYAILFSSQSVPSMMSNSLHAYKIFWISSRIHAYIISIAFSQIMTCDLAYNYKIVIQCNKSFAAFSHSVHRPLHHSHPKHWFVLCVYMCVWVCTRQLYFKCPMVNAHEACLSQSFLIERKIKYEIIHYR